jgi:hypothetical protein
MPHQTPAHLAQLPAYDPKTGELTAVIETPKGSRNKFDYDPGYAAFRLSGVLPEGMSFPYADLAGHACRGWLRADGAAGGRN